LLRFFLYRSDSFLSDFVIRDSFLSDSFLSDSFLSDSFLSDSFLSNSFQIDSEGFQLGVGPEETCLSDSFLSVFIDPFVKVIQNCSFNDFQLNKSFTQKKIRQIKIVKKRPTFISHFKKYRFGLSVNPLLTFIVRKK
jgi:hypothetical protein